jgi:hypothetical protein
MERAATLCVQYDFISYRKYEHILTSYQHYNLEHQDEEDGQPVIHHDNIRGASNYQ